MHSFSDAVNLPLKTDADYGRFIDPQVTGADRKLAIFFMRFMPPNMRGDFIYVNSAGKVLSNRLSVAAGVTFRHGVRMAPPLPGSRAASAMALRPDATAAQNCSGGACIRTYSVSGLNAMYGYADPPCDMSFGSGESGNMYFNAYDSNGNDVVDAGIGVNINAASAYSQFGNTSPPTVSFVNLGGGVYSSTGWEHNGQTYPCGQAVGIMYGTMPSPNQNYSLLMTGVPAFDPTSVNTPPSTTTWNPGAWDFWNTNPALLVSPTTWNGYGSNCSGCSVAAMFTIAQPGLSYDSSCYGYCGTSADAAWYELVAGQLIPTCNAPPQSSSETCTIEYTTSWQSNYYSDLGSGLAYSPGTSQQQVGEGINLTPAYPNTDALKRAFTNPPTVDEPPCTPDADGYCAIETSDTVTGDCVMSNPPLKPVVIDFYKRTYDIFQKDVMLELRETATETTSEGSSCPIVKTTWSPANPSTTYNDPSLP